MEPIDLSETTWIRATKDTERFRQSPYFFWSLEIGGALILAVVGGFVGFRLEPINPSRVDEWLFPTIGGVVGVVVGLVTAALLILFWNLVRAPYRQRDEARAILQQQRRWTPPANRDGLIRALTEWQSIIDSIQQIKPRLQSGYRASNNLQWQMQALRNRHRDAMNRVRTELIIAGQRVFSKTDQYLVQLSEAATTDQTGLEPTVAIAIGNMLSIIETGEPASVL